jgi:SAM-dependent methyltransferase
MNASKLETCFCSYCKTSGSSHWATERGFNVVKCDLCGFLYLNPRPIADERDKATRLGVHAVGGDLDISERYLPKKVNNYRSILRRTFADVWGLQEPVSWLDIGAGYGEIVDAVELLAPTGSTVVGLEPMIKKARVARSRGLNIISDYIGPDTPRSEFVSLIDVFSHINDFGSFLLEIRSVLTDHGELFIETGDIGSLVARDDFPGVLGLPDHVAFAGEKHLIGFLERYGFVPVSIEKARIDGVVYAAKNVVKKLIGRDVRLKLPYTSPYRTMRIRARKT